MSRNNSFSGEPHHYTLSAIIDRSSASDDGPSGVSVTTFAEQRKRKRRIDARLTQPKEFNFATAHRARPSRFISREEQEQLELESRPQFRANPLPVHVLEGASAAPPVFKRPPTEPQSPMLHTTARLGKKRRIEGPEATHQQKPLQTTDGSQSRESSRKKRKASTRPFQLMTDLRGQQAREALERALEEERRREEELRQFHARPLPAADAFRPAPAKAPLTEPKPYPLRTDERGHLKRESLARRLQEERQREEELRQFRARPLPCDEPFQPEPADAPLTEPKPFPLRTEERGAEKVMQLQHTLAQTAEQDKENRHFKALPLPTDAPFKPRPSMRPLTELNEFNLQSDTRAAQRASFEEKMRAKEAAEAEARRQAQLARAREEKREVKRLRKQLVHKARPIPLSVYQPMQALPSGKSLTEPASPCLLTKRRKHGDRASTLYRS